MATMTYTGGPAAPAPSFEWILNALRSFAGGFSLSSLSEDSMEAVGAAGDYQIVVRAAETGAFAPNDTLDGLATGPVGSVTFYQLEPERSEETRVMTLTFTGVELVEFGALYNSLQDYVQPATFDFHADFTMAEVGIDEFTEGQSWYATNGDDDISLTDFDDRLTADDGDDQLEATGTTRWTAEAGRTRSSAAPGTTCWRRPTRTTWSTAARAKTPP
jgi:hypothetical protein